MPSTPDDRDYAELARQAKARRLELGLALNDTNAAAGGLSNRTWQRVEKGLAIRDTNYAKIDRLLEWAPRSSIAVLEGGSPVPVKDVEGAAGEVVAEMPKEAIAERARDLVQLSLISMSDSATAEEIKRASERIVKDLLDDGLL
ncbi:MAG: hypothetical protein LBV78_24300 [Kitasatospora sp.]|jgi:hypothetical protein|nr:hypothetical protein [Kitasatospora sp.]